MFFLNINIIKLTEKIGGYKKSFFHGKNDVFIFNFDFRFHPKSFITENSDLFNLTQIKLPNLISH